MNNNRPSDADLFAALIATVKHIGGPIHERIILGIKCQHENGEEPDFYSLAGDMGVSLEILLTNFSQKLYERTGDISFPILSAPQRQAQ